MLTTAGVFRSFRAHPPSLLFSNNNPLRVTRRSPSVVLRCVQTTSARDSSNHPGGTGDKMSDQKKDPAEPKTGDDDIDTMSSFGEGYATKSDEEGFGGVVYGGNQYLRKDKPTEFDDSKQGSEVKEKEKARNRTSAS